MTGSGEPSKVQGNIDATLGAAKEKIGSAVGAHQCVPHIFDFTEAKRIGIALVFSSDPVCLLLHVVWLVCAAGYRV